MGYGVEGPLPVPRETHLSPETLCQHTTTPVLSTNNVRLEPHFTRDVPGPGEGANLAPEILRYTGLGP